MTLYDGERMTDEKKIIFRCARCHAPEVTRTADAAWNAVRKRWEVVELFNNAHCEKCGGETTLEEVTEEREVERI